MSNFLRAVQDLPTCRTLKTMHKRGVSSTLHFFMFPNFMEKGSTKTAQNWYPKEHCKMRLRGSQHRFKIAQNYWKKVENHEICT